jgi:hypothetical protein
MQEHSPDCKLILVEEGDSFSKDPIYSHTTAMAPAESARVKQLQRQRHTPSARLCSALERLHYAQDERDKLIAQDVRPQSPLQHSAAVHPKTETNLQLEVRWGVRCVKNVQAYL